MRTSALLCAWPACALLLACGDDLPPAEDPTDELFRRDRLLEIEVELAPADWDLLRVQHADLFGQLVDDCPGPLPDDPYTVFPAAITIDGERFEDVSVRKKGFLGSINRTRPSLKISFDEIDPDREVFGLERLTLNNNQQDVSHLDTCLAYQVFADAGIAAPRCNWAHVTVNGEDLGVYSNVESVRRRFLARHFEDSSGNLYEGQVADLRPSWVERYEDKNGNDGDRSDLDAVVEALEADDDELIDALEAVVDVDQFLTFWATEVLVGHWDGYNGNRNNHYLYRDPSTGRFHFLPWGPDSAFGDPNPFLAQQPPPSVWANNILASRLYATDAGRARYRERLRELLDTVWDEQRLLDEIDRASELVAPHVHVPDAAFEDAVEKVRDFVTDQRDRLEEDLAADPDWTVPLPDSHCAAIKGSASGTFSAPFADFPPENVFAGSGTLAMTLDGADLEFESVFAGAGPNNDPSHPRFTMGPFGVLDGGDILIPAMLVEPEVWTEQTLAVDGYDVFGILVRTNIATPDALVVVGFLRGEVTIDAAPTTDGETVSGSFDLEIIQPLD